MNRNIIEKVITIEEISNVVLAMNSETEISLFFKELLTDSEIQTLSKRWQILRLLKEGKTQREVAQTLGVSLCNVTRGAKIIKNKKNIIYRILSKEN